MPQRKFSALVSFLLVSGSSVFPAWAEDRLDAIVIDEPSPLARTADNTLPLIGFRSAFPVLLDRRLVDKPGDVSEEAYFVPETVLIKAWMQDAKFSAAVASVSKAAPTASASIKQLKEAGIEIEKFEWLPIGGDASSIRPISFEGTKVIANEGKIDSSAIIAMTAAGMIDLTKTYDAGYSKDQIKAVGFDAKFSNDVFKTYAGASSLSGQSFSSPTYDWGKTKNLVELANIEYPIDVRKTLTFNLGNVTFGRPRLVTAKEAQFKLDKTLAASSDVYFAKFAFTAYDIPEKSIEELSFRISCGKACVAWELAPLRVMAGEEKEDTLKTPTISIKGVEVGEMFSRTIKYTTLRPQILAYGVQEDQFSWSIKDAAIENGSHVFVAAIGVPKGTKEIRFERSIAAKTAVGWLSEGGWVSTATASEMVQLKP
jgi:hypothetical protein